MHLVQSYTPGMALLCYYLYMWGIVGQRQAIHGSVHMVLLGFVCCSCATELTQMYVLMKTLVVETSYYQPLSCYVNCSNASEKELTQTYIIYTHTLQTLAGPLGCYRSHLFPLSAIDDSGHPILRGQQAIDDKRTYKLKSNVCRYMLSTHVELLQDSFSDMM